MRTIEEIKKKIRNPVSIFEFEADALICFLGYDDAKEFLKPEIARDKWEGVTVDSKSIPLPLTREGVIAEVKEYMPFAIEKSLNHRGLSASRSIAKMEAWVWLLGDDPIDAGYTNYGAPILRAICERYGINWKEIADWDVESFIRMSEGKKCRIDCDEGCSR